MASQCGGPPGAAHGEGGRSKRQSRSHCDAKSQAWLSFWRFSQVSGIGYDLRDHDADSGDADPGQQPGLEGRHGTTRTFDFAFEEVPVLIDAFRRMVRGLEFDISEMAITTYLCAKEHGKRFTALPIFLVRAFHHGAIHCSENSDIRTPKDLEGKKVGVNRGYTVTTGVWARGVLQQEHGVDLNKITWVLSGDEHVLEYRPPANVVPMAKETTLQQMLAAGELAATIGIESNDPAIRQLIPQAQERGLDALRRRGHYPINHLMVVKDDVLAAHPQVAGDVFEAFVEAKRRYLDRLTSGAIDQPTPMDQLHRRVMEISGDPLPYGIEPNRAMLEELIQHALTQGIIRRRVNPEELFAPSTHDLVA